MDEQALNRVLDQEEGYEVVPTDEPSLEDYPTHNEANEQLFDEFGAPVRKVVRVVEGPRDSRRL